MKCQDQGLTGWQCKRRFEHPLIIPNEPVDLRGYVARALV